MVCASPAYRGREEENVAWENWSGRVSGRVGRYFEPDALTDLVSVVRRATHEGRRLKVVGSSWSQEDLAYSSDWMVDIRRLNGRLRHVFAHGTDAVVGSVARITDTLAHFEAGIEIAHLNDELDRLGLAMPALGGANGQTLAGAISTGVHGGDIDFPPLPDFVAAVHFVTTGGREIWVEPALRPVTDDVQLAACLECPDLEIIRDDNVFEALLVSLGRFGVLYSCVLRVRPAFKVAEWTVKIPQDQLLSSLRAGQADGRLLRFLFDLLPDPPAHLLAVDVKNPRGLEVVFDTQNTGECYVRRRWPTTGVQDVNIQLKLDSLCDAGPRGVLERGIHAMEAARLLLNLDPVLGATWGSIIAAEEAGLRDAYARNPNMSAGEMLARLLEATWNSHLGFAIPRTTKDAFDERYAESLAGRRGPYHIIATGYRQQNQQNCYRADSVEPIFDASKPEYISFVESILRLIGGFRQAGYISLRWSANSRALIAMHGFGSSTGVAVEVTSLKRLSDNERWMAMLETLAFSFNGRLHWGQRNSLTEPLVTRLYGEKLARWRSILTALLGDDRIFSNQFTVQRGLEPLGAEGATLRGVRLEEVTAAWQAAVTALLLSDDNIVRP